MLSPAHFSAILGTFQKSQIRKVIPGKTFVQIWPQARSILGHSRIFRYSTFQKFLTLLSSLFCCCRGVIGKTYSTENFCPNMEPSLYWGIFRTTRLNKIKTYSENNVCPNTAWSRVYLGDFSELPNAQHTKLLVHWINSCLSWERSKSVR